MSEFASVAEEAIAGLEPENPQGHTSCSMEEGDLLKFYRSQGTSNQITGGEDPDDDKETYTGKSSPTSWFSRFVSNIFDGFRSFGNAFQNEYVWIALLCLALIILLIFLVKRLAHKHSRECDYQQLSEESSESYPLSVFRNAFESTGVLFTLIFIILLLILFLLGVLKGLIGLCCVPYIGIVGLEYLIELPRPLPKYQEKEIENRPVQYDVGGWPIHPETKERTVRILPKQTEFCLNTVFFLSLPLALLLQLCAFCCCIRNYKDDGSINFFKSVNIIRLIECTKSKVRRKNKHRKSSPKKACKCSNCSYGQNKYSKQEAEDTEYVVNAMKTSQASLQEPFMMCCCDDVVLHSKDKNHIMSFI